MASGSFIAAEYSARYVGDQLLVLKSDGELWVVAADAEAFDLLAQYGVADSPHGLTRRRSMAPCW